MPDEGSGMRLKDVTRRCHIVSYVVDRCLGFWLFYTSCLPAKSTVIGQSV